MTLAIDEVTVLSVEDNPNSVLEVVSYLKRHGADVLEVVDVDRAEDVVSARRVDAILLDVRVPGRREDEQHGGLAFIKRLKRGSLGDLNRDVPFLVLTSFIYDSQLTELSSVAGFAGPVFSKAQVSPTEVTSALGIFDPGQDGPRPYFVDALLTVNAPPTRGQVTLHADSWPVDEEVNIPEGEFPPEVQQEFDYDEYPLYIWARVNIDAETAAELMPTNFRLSLAREEDLQRFDVGEAPLQGGATHDRG